MKANEAPEKIYIDDFGSEISHDWHTEHSYENDIEYIRTDAFIEKACEYLQKNMWRIVCEENEFRQRFVTDFKNYMKGE